MIKIHIFVHKIEMENYNRHAKPNQQAYLVHMHVKYRVICPEGLLSILYTQMFGDKC